MYRNVMWTGDKVARLCVIVILMCIVIKVYQNDSENFEKGNLPPCMYRESKYNSKPGLNNFASYDSENQFEEYFNPNKLQNQTYMMSPKAKYAWGGHRTSWQHPGMNRIGRIDVENKQYVNK